MIHLLLLTLAHAACGLDPRPDVAFEERHVDANGVHVVLELWVPSAAQAPWAHGLLDRLDRLGLPAVVIVPLEPTPSAELVALVDRAAAGPHEVAVALDEAQLPTDVLDKPGPLRKALSPYQSVAPVKVAYAPIQARASEAILGKVGFRTLVDTLASASGSPKMAGHLEGQPRVNVVLPPGAYDDDCGPDPRMGPFSPAVADRAMAAILRSGVDATATPTARVALDGGKGSSHDGDVLERWITEVLKPSAATVQTASAARADALQGFRRTPVGQAPTSRATPGRLVSTDRIEEAARAIRDTGTLPRLLPGDLSPTEAFLAMAMLLVDGPGDGTVRLRPLAGPATSGRALEAPATIDREALVATLRQLLSALPAELPISLPVDGRLLTSGELLSAMASAVLGEDPVLARPMSDPDPHARGLGWGTSAP